MTGLRLPPRVVIGEEEPREIGEAIARIREIEVGEIGRIDFDLPVDPIPPAAVPRELLRAILRPPAQATIAAIGGMVLGIGRAASAVVSIAPGIGRRLRRRVRKPWRRE
jgi:hypothetical protein